MVPSPASALLHLLPYLLIQQTFKAYAYNDSSTMLVAGDKGYFLRFPKRGK